MQYSAAVPRTTAQHNGAGSHSQPCHIGAIFEAHDQSRFALVYIIAKRAKKVPTGLLLAARWSPKIWCWPRTTFWATFWNIGGHFERLAMPFAGNLMIRVEGKRKVGNRKNWKPSFLVYPHQNRIRHIHPCSRVVLYQSVAWHSLTIRPAAHQHAKIGLTKRYGYCSPDLPTFEELCTYIGWWTAIYESCTTVKSRFAFIPSTTILSITSLQSQTPRTLHID